MINFVSIDDIETVVSKDNVILFNINKLLYSRPYTLQEYNPQMKQPLRDSTKAIGYVIEHPYFSKTLLNQSIQNLKHLGLLKHSNNNITYLPDMNCLLADNYNVFLFKNVYPSLEHLERHIKQKYNLAHKNKIFFLH